MKRDVRKMAPDTTPDGEWSTRLTTNGGIDLYVRPATTDDQRQMLDFLRALSIHDLRFRFLGAVRPSEGLAQVLTRVDDPHAASIVAFDASDGRLAATAMVVGESSPDAAELAIVIRSDLRYKGIGRALLALACDFARARGFQRVECIESSENRDFIAVEEQFGFEVRRHPGDATLTIMTKELEPA